MTHLISQPQTESASKFEDLCRVYVESFEEVAAYLNTCGQFANQLVIELEQYLQCPDRRIQLLNSAGVACDLHNALYSDQGWWHLDLEMTICREHAHRRRAVVFSGRYYPSQSVIIPVLLRQISPDQFAVKLDGFQQSFNIHLNEKEEFYAFYDYVAAAIKTHYRNMQRYLTENGETPLRLIGQSS